MDADQKDNLTIKKALSYANGYRELGMLQDALEELAKMPDALADRIEIHQMRLAILFDAKDWPAAECAAKTIALREPEDPGAIVNLAFATRRSKSMQEAKQILLAAVDRFANVAIIHYNLACYDCVDSNLETAKERLVKSISLDPSFLDTAKSDDDLKPLTDWLENLEIA